MEVKFKAAHKMLKDMIEAFTLYDSGLAKIDFIPEGCTLKTIAGKEQVVLLLPVYGELCIIWSTAATISDGAPIVLEGKKIVPVSEEESDILLEAYMCLCMENKIR